MSSAVTRAPAAASCSVLPPGAAHMSSTASPGCGARRRAGSAAAGCATDLDCELTGSCDAASGRCRCYPGWIGPTCGTLDLLPAPQRGVVALRVEDF